MTGVWKYWNILLVSRQVIWKKLRVRTKSYLSWFFFYKHLILVNTVANLNLFILSITSLHKIWNKVLIKLTQTSLHKFKFEFPIGMCSQRIAVVFRYRKSCAENFFISIKIILINLGNGFIHQTSHVFSFSAVFILCRWLVGS